DGPGDRGGRAPAPRRVRLRRRSRDAGTAAFRVRDRVPRHRAAGDPVTDRELARQILTALATSDVDRVRELTAEDVALFGTDEGERWDDLDSLIDALVEMRALGLTAAWGDDVRSGNGWVAGTAIYRLADGSELPTRVSLVFEDDRLVHGHFSVAR